MGGGAGSSAAGTFMLLLVFMVFAASVIAAASAFFYLRYLNSSIVSKAEDLRKTEEAFDPESIREIMRLDSRFRNANTLLQNHTTVLGIFNVLEQETLVNVQFTQFGYTPQADGSAQITMSGIAHSFATLALQSDQFGKSKALKNVVFSGISVGEDNRIRFSVQATVEPSVLSYAKNFANARPTVQGQVEQSQATTTRQAPATQPASPMPTPGVRSQPLP